MLLSPLLIEIFNYISTYKLYYLVNFPFIFYDYSHFSNLNYISDCNPLPPNLAYAYK